MSGKTRIDYSTLSDAEINAKLAEKMGRGANGEQCLACGAFISGGFTPCTSRDDLAVILADIRRLAMDDILDDALWAAYGKQHEYTGPFIWFFLLTCPPRIIAEACLEVLE